MIFTFRNDDVREKTDDSLIKLHDLFLKYKVPISYAIEPGNVGEAAEWLKHRKKENPDLIEIIQHGYLHRINVCYKQRHKVKKGEFGGERTYEEEYNDIKAGVVLMNDIFNDDWFASFTFPYGSKSIKTIRALDHCDFKVMNDQFGIAFKHQMVYMLGYLLRKNFLFGISIPWDLKLRPGTSIFNINFSLGPIKKYNNAWTESEMYSISEWIENTLRLIKKKHLVIGNVFHHRYHNTKEKMQLIENYLIWCKSQNDAEFLTQKQIYNRFSNL